MGRQAISLSGAAVFTVAALAFGLTLLPACSEAARPASSSPAGLTPVQDIAYTIEEALGLARDRFNAAPPFVVHEIQSVVYVNTTVGQARDLFDPAHTTRAWDTRDDLPAWVVVGSGKFQVRSVPGSATAGPSYTTVWVVIPKGELGLFWSPSTQYDLTQLGTLVEVPVPLPPFPTPVTLNGQ